MTRSRYHFVLIEEPDTLPALYRGAKRESRLPPPAADPVDAMRALLEAFASLSRRGDGPEAWALPLSANPLAFLLDAVSDAVYVRAADGHVVFRNRAAHRFEPAPRPTSTTEELIVDGHRFRRRIVSFGSGDYRLFVEVVSERVAGDDAQDTE